MTGTGYTFYSKSAGLEVSEIRTIKRNRIQGRVRFRLFPLEEGGRERQVILMLDPLEAFKLSVSYTRRSPKNVPLRAF